MRRYRFILLIFFLVYAVSIAVPNLVYICVDGASRDTFFALIQKDALPTFKQMMGQGNYRKMVADQSLSYTQRYQVLMGMGHESDQNQETLFDRIKQVYPSSQISLLFSYHDSDSDQLNTMDIALSDYLDISLYQQRNTFQIASYMKNFINRNPDPFVLMVNFPEPAFIASRFREGCYEYSLAIKNIDKALASVIKLLKTKQLFDNTIFVITTDRGVQKRSQLFNQYTWILASFKSYKEGSINEVVPSILFEYGIEDLNFDPLQVL